MHAIGRPNFGEGDNYSPLMARAYELEMQVLVNEEAFDLYNSRRSTISLIFSGMTSHPMTIKTFKAIVLVGGVVLLFTKIPTAYLLTALAVSGVFCCLRPDLASRITSSYRRS